MNKFDQVVESLKEEGYEVDAESVRVEAAFGYHKCGVCDRVFDEEENALFFRGERAGGFNTRTFCLDRVACHASIAAKEAAKKQASAVRVSRVENEVRLPSDPTDGGDE